MESAKKEKKKKKTLPSTDKTLIWGLENFEVFCYRQTPILKRQNSFL